MGPPALSAGGPPTLKALIGLSLLFLGLRFFVQALLGLSHHSGVAQGAAHWLQQALGIAPPKTPDVPPGQLPIVVTVLVISVLLSWLMSTYQIRLGRKLKHRSLVADGRETFSDSLVEMAVLASILSSVLLGISWIDAIATLVISGFLFHTSHELLSASLGIIQNRSIDQERLDQIALSVESINEVERVEREGKGRLMAFRLGKGMIVTLKVYVSRTLTMAGFQQTKRALSTRISRALDGLETILIIRPSVLRSRSDAVLTPLIAPKFERGRIDGVIAEEPEQAEEWILVESIGETARSMRRVGCQREGESLGDFAARVGADRVILATTQDGLDIAPPTVSRWRHCPAPAIHHATGSVSLRRSWPEPPSSYSCSPVH